MVKGRKLTLRVAKINHNTSKVTLLLEKFGGGNISILKGKWTENTGVIEDYNELIELLGFINQSSGGVRGLSIGDAFTVIIKKKDSD